MAELLLDSLEIENFRAFKHLKIEKLGRVNLIVGQNSVGKTALLEALWLYANRGSFSVVLNVLRARNELNRLAISNNQIEDEEAVLNSLKTLFYGRKDIRNTHIAASIGSIKLSQKRINISIDKVELNPSSLENGSQYDLNSKGNLTLNSIKLLYSVRNTDLSNAFQGTVLERGGRLNIVKPDGLIANNFVSTGGIIEATASRLWNNITLTNLEDYIIKALKIIIPKIERVAVVAELGANSDYSILVKMEKEESRVPLRSLGDGLNRVFGIALALVNSKDGILLVDEIENGLHFTTQLDLWRLIFAIARQLNVQVFATTHSWDCIQAFQQASSEDPELGMAIRLNNIDGEITATSFDERRLAIVTKEQIEVR